MPHHADVAAKALNALQAQLDAVGAALLANNPDALESASTQLRGVALGFAQTLEASIAAGGLNTELKNQVKAQARRIGVLREQLARRALGVQRALATVLPQEAAESLSSTYSASAGASARGGVARIYAARG